MLRTVQVDTGVPKLQSQAITPSKNGVIAKDKGPAAEEEQSLSPLYGELIVAQKSHVTNYRKTISDEALAKKIKNRSEKNDVKPTQSNLNFTGSEREGIASISFITAITKNEEVEDVDLEFEQILDTHYNEMESSINFIRETLKQLYSFIKTLTDYDIIQLTDPKSRYKFEPESQLLGIKMDDGTVFSDFKKGKIGIDNIRKAIMGLKEFKLLFPSNINDLEFDQEDFEALTSEEGPLFHDDFTSTEISAEIKYQLNVDKVKEKIITKLNDFMQSFNSKLCGFTTDVEGVDENDINSRLILQEMLPEQTYEAFIGYTNAFKTKAYLPIIIMINQLNLIHREVGSDNKYYELAATKFRNLANGLLLKFENQLLPQIKGKFDDTYKNRSKNQSEYDGLFCDSDFKRLMENLESLTTRVLETKDAAIKKTTGVFKEFAEEAYLRSQQATQIAYAQGINDGASRTLGVLKNSAPLAMAVVNARAGGEDTVFRKVHNQYESTTEAVANGHRAQAIEDGSLSPGL